MPIQCDKTIRVAAALALLIPALASAQTPCGSNTGQYLAGSAEIIYTGVDAQPLCDKARELGTVAKMYEYLRNNAEYALYHGARSGSINSFMGLRGNDVDLAATLIAMLRSQNVPARYAVGDVQIAADKVMNWLGVRNLDLAVSIMKDQGIQHVVLATDRSYVQLEHVWVEALVPFGRYRGVEGSIASTNCATDPQKCNWVSLDPSFKLKKYKDDLIDVYGAANFPGFDYNGYYNAMNPATLQFAKYKDKNPREIYEEQILDFLRVNYPGRTLEDVADTGTIVSESLYVLPASLPYGVVAGTVRRYASVAEQGAAPAPAEPKKWSKYVTVTAQFLGADGNPDGRFVQISTNLVKLATSRFTLTMTPNGPSGVFLKAGSGSISISGGSGSLTINGDPLAWNLVGPPLVVNQPFTLVVEMAGAPSQTSNPADDHVITAQYPGCIVGGYYLIGTGGDSSNWSQVHRAAATLLAADQQYKIVFNPGEAGCDLASGINCTPYIDTGAPGYDASDQRLLDNDPAMSDLTGALLYVAMSQYFAKFREDIERLDALNHVKSPIEGFVGVVSSTFEVEYIGDTAFSVLPGGLLIDMKGQKLSGNWRTSSAAEYANKHFELLGHGMSSLEHEIWQELTGYDAVSTVRGIQMALAKGAQLVDAVKNGTTDNVAAAYTQLGFSNGAAPAPFAIQERNVFTTRPATWIHNTVGASFDMLKSSIGTSTPSLRTSRLTYLYSGPNGGPEGWVKCVDNIENQLNSLIAQFGGGVQIQPFNFCDNSVHSGAASTVLSELQTNYFDVVIPGPYGGQQFFDYLNENNGFVPSEYVYRANPIAVDAHATEFVQQLRNNLYLTSSGFWREFVLPSKQTCGASYRFSVYLDKVFETTANKLVSQSFTIKNNSAGASCP